MELLYRENRFIQGTLTGRGQKPCLPRSKPLLSVIDKGSDVVPPSVVLPFHDAVGSTERKVLCYEGDSGVALPHVGVLVGRRAHRHLWPEIIRWLNSHGA